MVVKNDSDLLNVTKLRNGAEVQMKAAKQIDAAFIHMTPEDRRQLHELQVHQIELEMQNAELLNSRDMFEQSLQQYADLYDFAPIGFFTLDRNGTIVSVNLSGAGLLGIERSQLISRRFIHFISEEDRFLFSDFLSKVFDNHLEESCELRFAASTAILQFVQIFALETMAGQSCSIAVLDISARRRSEDLQHQAEELNSNILEALPAHIAVIDRQGVIISVNQAWTDFARGNGGDNSLLSATGINYIEVCRRAAADNISDAAQALEGILSILDGTLKQFSMEYPCHSPEQQRWFSMTVVPLGLAGNNGAVITHTDISKRIESEIALRLVSNAFVT